MHAKTIVLFCFLLSVSLICSSQSLTVYKKDPCSNQTIQLKHFLVKKGTATYFPDSTTYAVTVPEPGEYILQLPEKLHPVQILINPGENIYTYRGNLIQQEIRMHQSPLYSCCGKPCEGPQKDYYENGNILISGNFIKGSPNDTLTFYNINGTLFSQEIYTGKQATFVKYDSVGNLLERTIYKNGEAESHTEFYLSGQKKKAFSYKNSSENIIEFYESGAIAVQQDKNKRIEYFSNGVIKKHIQRKKINHLSNFCWEKLLFWQKSYCENFIDFRYRFKQYDEAGNLLLDGITEDYAVDEHTFQTRPRDTTWVIRLRYKENNTWKEDNNLSTKHLGTKHLMNIGVD